MAHRFEPIPAHVNVCKCGAAPGTIGVICPGPVDRVVDELNEYLAYFARDLRFEFEPIDYRSHGFRGGA